jgi:hypothetical protein
VICLGLVVLAVRSYVTRRRFQRRFFDLVGRGYVVPVFDLGSSNSQPLPCSQPIPELNEVVVLKTRVRWLANPAKWADAQVSPGSHLPYFELIPSMALPLFTAVAACLNVDSNNT